VANADGSQPFQLTFLENALAGTPRWSPDGSSIAFDATDGEIRVVSAKGGTAANLTNHPARDTVPSWSRDGRWVYFSSDRSGGREIWRAPCGGGEASRITRGGGEVAYESPDGAWLYYTKPRPDTALWRMRLPGGPESRVVERIDFRAFHPRREGIYHLSGEHPAELRFLDLATGGVRALAKVDHLHNGFSVSADGRRIAFSRVGQ
jgi:Tol biopolymer transport system component